MFCPKCATQNADGARFCRSCGANISLLPAALSGDLQSQTPVNIEPLDDFGRRGRRRRGRVPNQADGIKQLFMGLGFLVLSFVLAVTGNGRGFWFWMLIPAFSLIGGGISMIVRARTIEDANRRAFQMPNQANVAGVPPPNIPQPMFGNAPSRQTGELVQQPPSVTEGTTRHLGAEGPTRHFTSTDKEKSDS